MIFVSNTYICIVVMCITTKQIYKSYAIRWNYKIFSKGLKDFKRIETVNNSSNVLMYFLKNGFRILMRLKLSYSFFYPEVDEKRLWIFGTFVVDGNICDVLELVIEKNCWIVMSTNHLLLNQKLKFWISKYDYEDAYY
jgi:hypothetical protein